MLHFTGLPVFGDMIKQESFGHKHHSRLQAFNSYVSGGIKAYIICRAIYYNLACSMVDVFVDSCKETAYGHHLRSFAQAIFCR